MAKVYISSTYLDLIDHRKRVYEQLRKSRHDAISIEWAMTQVNLAGAFEGLGDLSEGEAKDHYKAALTHIDAALEIMTAAHLPHYHQVATDTRNRIQAKLDALS